MSSTSLEKIITLQSPDGNYRLRDIITLEGATDFGSPTRVSMASLKSSQQEEHSITSTSSKFIEIPANDDKFSFLKSNKKPKPIVVTKTNSQFVSKIVANENLAKMMSKGGETFYMFYNVGKALAWTDYLWKLQSPLSVIYFKDAYVTCHDVNLVNREAMNAVVGFNTGDILCFWPLSGKYTRLNRGGTINKTPVTCIKWIPGSENEFMVAFEDGRYI
jgi:catabolite repression protein CreC